MSDGDADIRISIILVTYNRAPELVRLLDSLRADLARSDVELIVVDDGSTDDTLVQINATMQALGDRGRVHRQANMGPGTARNRGIAAAQGDILVFLDTDCVVQPEWLDALTAPFVDDAVGAVGGPDRSHPGDPFLARVIDYLMTSFITTGGVRGSAVKRAGTYHPRSFNMAARRDAAADAGGFPTVWYGEDILFSRRIQQAGSRCELALGAWLYHLRRTSVRGWMRQLYRMGRARWWMARHDAGLIDAVYMVPLAEIVAGVAVVAGIAVGGVARIAALSALGSVAAYLMVIAVHGAVRVRSIAALLAVPALFAIRECAYAAGSVAGILTRVPDLAGRLAAIAGPDAREPASGDA